MFYSETLQSPISSANIKRMYGVNAENDPAKAMAIGIYPVIDCPEGYTPTHYTKEGNAYRAVPSDVSDAEKVLLYRVRETKMSLEEAADSLKLPDTTDLVDELPKKKGRKK